MARGLKMEIDGKGRAEDRQWLHALRLFLGTSIVCHSIWEVLQLPLYTIWSTGTAREIIFAVVHCTLGDLMITTLSLVAALVCLGGRSWPSERFVKVMLAAMAIGISYTIYSEWMNTTIRKAWAYSELMPVIPVLGTGLSPLMQWLVVPAVGFASVWYWRKLRL